MKRLIAALTLTLFAGFAAAQTPFPSRTVTIVVPFAPGGSTDVVARLMAQRMGKVLGQSVIVENVSGAGGSIGVGRVARAAPDGYTIDIGQWDTHVANGVVYPQTLDQLKEMTPIGMLSINPQIILGRKTLPVEDMKGLVAWLKANPGKATFANQSAAAQTAGVLLQQLTGTEVLLVPYRGAGPAMQDLIAGHIDLHIAQAAAALPQVRGGTVKVFANMSPSRSAVVPNIPTTEEAGVPGLHISGWFGFFGPKGMPKDVVAKLNDAMVQSLADPAIRARFADLGLDVASREQQTPEGLTAFTKAEIDKWWPIIKAAGIKSE
jgi:tripartite-type tricarboxylate transporter receptor subunit TctC